MQTDTDILALTDLALIPPVLDTDPSPKYGYDQLDYGMTVGVERTRGGRLWASWVGGGDNENAFLVLAISDDDGATWSAPRLVIDPHDASLPMSCSVISGVPWLDPQGCLWLFFSQSVGYFDGRMGIWAARCDQPDADSPTWTPAERIWHGFALNKPTVLSTGEWMLPAALWPRELLGCGMVESAAGSPFLDAFHELDAYRLGNVLVSRDEGRTWERRGGTAFPCAVDFIEQMVVEKRDGSLWMIVRTLTEGMWQSVSRDGGVTWSTGEPWLPHVNSRHFIRRLSSGRLLLVKHGVPVNTRPSSRSHLAAYLSDDDGVTWQGGLVLDEREGVSYPDGALSPDGTLYVTYDRNRDTDGEVLLARFTEADVLAGRLVSPGSALRLLVSRPNPAAVAVRHAERKKDILRRLIGDADLRFIHIPAWRAWDGVGAIEMSKLNMNNGGALPALDRALPPEIHPDATHHWKELTPAADEPVGFVSFAPIAAPGEGQVGYARAYVRSLIEQPGVFLLGADYWMQFRVNGKTLIDHAREIRPSWTPELHEFRADAVLRAGWNLLEVKVASGQGGFAFACQVAAAEGLRFCVDKAGNEA
ncbi:MAG: sialidase family protein [Verrucomicrobiota bacterium]